MKKIMILITALFTVIMLQAQQVNDVNAEIREAKGYNAINVSNAFDVYLTQSNEEAVAVSAAETKSRDRIKVEVKAGTLYIKYDSDGKSFWNTGNKKLKAYISFKDISKLNISGACDVYITGTLKASKLNINQSGASDLKGKLDVDDLEIDLSGASDMNVTGVARAVSVQASGASDFKGYELVSETCNARASGASSIKVTVNKELSAHASGASDVHYKGKGVIREVKSNGASSVSRG